MITSNSIDVKPQNDLEGFLRLPEVLKIIPVSKTAWWTGVQSHRFPKPIKLGPRTTAWRVKDIRKLIHELGGK